MTALTLLIADDDCLSRMILERLAVKWGLRYLSAADGEAARRLLECHRVDVCILDWDMPGLNGLELCRWLRSGRREHAPYIIINTARNNVVDIQRAFDAGADDFLVKPIDYQYLRQQLQSLSARAQHRLKTIDRAAQAGMGVSSSIYFSPS